MVVIPPIHDRGDNVRRHAGQFGHIFGGRIIHVEPAFLVADAIDDVGAFVFGWRPEDAELAPAELNVFEIRGIVLQIAGVIFAGALAFAQILIEERFGLFDASQSQVMRLDAIAVILLDEQIQVRGVQHADDDNREQRHAPEQPDQYGGAASH
jgi:hypothetical protein